MTKEAMLHHIKSAHHSHNYQLQKIMFLIKGVPLDEEPTPVSYKTCGFGTWLYGDEELLRELVGSKSFEEIEQKHIHWHMTYQKIYEIYYGQAKKGLFAKLTGGRPKVDSLYQDKAKAYFNDLQQITSDLLQRLTVLEKRIENMSEGHFSKT